MSAEFAAIVVASVAAAVAAAGLFLNAFSFFKLRKTEQVRILHDAMKQISPPRIQRNFYHCAPKRGRYRKTKQNVG
jgi:hypothetical protein